MLFPLTLVHISVFSMTTMLCYFWYVC